MEANRSGTDQQARLGDEVAALVAARRLAQRGAPYGSWILRRELCAQGLPRPRAKAAVRRLKAKRLLVPRSTSILSRLLPSPLVALTIPAPHEPVAAAMAWSRRLPLDLDVIVEVYEGVGAGDAIPNPGVKVGSLLARMRERGVTDSRLVLKALDMLFDRGMIRTEDHEHGAPLLFVAGEAEKFVAFLSAQRRVT